MDHPNTVIRTFLCFAVALSTLEGCQGSKRIESPSTVSFVYLARSEGTAEEATEKSSSDGSVLLKVEGPRFKGSVQLYDVASDKPVGPEIRLAEAGVSYRVTALAIAPDNQTIATALGNFSNDWGQVRVWDARTGTQIAIYQGPTSLGEVFKIAFDRDGKILTIESGPAGGK
jgi:WD40 repeat protein